MASYRIAEIDADVIDWGDSEWYDALGIMTDMELLEIHGRLQWRHPGGDYIDPAANERVLKAWRFALFQTRGEILRRMALGND